MTQGINDMQDTSKGAISRLIKLKKISRALGKTQEEITKKHVICGRLHRKDGPARIFKSGREEWWLYGVEHREDGPAIMNRNDMSEEWFFRGEYHRDGGPAITYALGATEWHSYGHLHREDGPAIMTNFIIEWHLHGKRVKSKEEYQELVGLSDEDMTALILKYGNRFDEYK